MSRKIKTTGIYKIVHLSSNRVYIGSARDIESRWAAHRFGFNVKGRGNPYLLHAWIKYGEQDFKFEIIEVVDDENNLLEREQYWIDEYKSFNRDVGFNIAPKAGSSLGIKQTKETIDKRVKKILGRKCSNETKYKMSKAAMGNKNGQNSHWHGVIAQKDILPIFEKVARGILVEDVAEEYKVNRVTIGRIINRSTWWGIDVPEEIVSAAQDRYKNRRKQSLRLHPKVTKLSEKDVTIIKRRLLNSETGAKIAKEYGVTPETIYAIKSGRNWNEIKPAPLL